MQLHFTSHFITSFNKAGKSFPEGWSTLSPTAGHRTIKEVGLGWRKLGRILLVNRLEFYFPRTRYFISRTRYSTSRKFPPFQLLLPAGYTKTMQIAQLFHAPTITSEKILKLTFLVLIPRLMTHKIFRKLKKQKLKLIFRFQKKCLTSHFLTTKTLENHTPAT